jgi:murein L,D-transpeptidase YafK
VSGIVGAANKAVRQMWKPWHGGLIWIFPVLALIALTGVAVQPHAETLVQADKVIVLKHERKLYLMRQGESLKWFWIALGRYPVGRKTERGDGRTPEGIYRILGRDASSHYYRALWLSYPNSADRERAERLGINPGGGIMIHAVPKGFEPTGPGEPMIDWTDGCIAVTNADMDEIWARVPDGTPVEIRP